ncbi:hypothetical protein [Sphingomonas sanxanigenens]|nr:hypothetical protein [Sphingomonas sanxanigenens]
MLRRRVSESLEAAERAGTPEDAERHRGFARLYEHALQSSIAAESKSCQA